MRRLRAILALVLALAVPVRAERNGIPKAEAPARLSRVLKTFDFEERDRGNVEGVPAGWLKIEGPGLPHYLHGEFDSKVAASGAASFRFDLNGGSVIYRYPAGQIPVMAHAMYRVSVLCRTTPLVAARAQVTAYLCDIDGHVLTDTIVSSDAFTSEAGDDTFHTLTLDIAADDPHAASLVLELSLLQPSMQADNGLGDKKLLVEDIHGSAWFDELRIAQVPTVSLTTERPTNVVPNGKPVTLRVGVLDRIATDLTAELRIFDVDGKPVQQRTGAIDFSSGDPSKGEQLTGAAAMPPLPPGWYDARLTIRSRGQVVAERSLKFVCAGDAPLPTRPDERFGLTATALQPDAWSPLPMALEDVAAGRVKISAWDTTHAIETRSAPAFDRLLDATRPAGRSVTACLTAPPPELQKLVGGDRWTDLLRVPTERWQPALAYMIARYATQLDRWQLMPDEDADAIARDPERRAVFARFYEEFSRLTGTPSLLMPWPAMFDREPGAPGAAALLVPGDVLPEQIPLYIRDVREQSSDQELSVTLRTIDPAKYGRPAQLRDLALRIAYSLAAGVDRIDLPLPFTVTKLRDGGSMLEPDPTLPAQRTLTAALANARYAGKMSLCPGVDAFLFDRDGSGVMLVSSSSTAPLAPAGRVRIALGKRATRLELDGAMSVVPRAKPDKTRPDDFDLEIGANPFLVTDIDAPLMLLRASVAIDNPMLESSVAPVGRSVTFRNTFDQPISGTLQLVGPPGWQVSPISFTFALNPGETFTAPISVTFPMNAASGDKLLTADIRLQAREEYRLAVPIAVKLGLSDVGLQTFAVRSGNEVIVQQFITNYGNRPINYNAFVTVAGLPRQERIVSDLQPGKVVIRKYRLPLPKSSQAEKLRSGVREIEGKRMLNDEVDIR